MQLQLLKEEQLVSEEAMSTSLLFFWLKSKFVLTSKRIVGEEPNTLLGLIPLGKKDISFPINKIAGVASDTKFHFGRLLFGTSIFIIGLFLFGTESPVAKLIALLLLIAGLIKILNCYTSFFVISNSGGQNTGVELSILERSKIKQLVQAINEKVIE